MTDGRGWHWVDEQGVERTLDTNELMEALENGTLSPDTKVRREEIDGWVSAGDVPELFPRSLRPPPVGPAGATPLPRPVAKPSLPPAVPRRALPTLVGHAPVAPGSSRGAAPPSSRSGGAPRPGARPSSPPPPSSRTLPPPSMRAPPPSTGAPVPPRPPSPSARPPAPPAPPVRPQAEPVEVSAEIDTSVVQPPPVPTRPPPPPSVRPPTEPVEVSAEIDTSEVAAPPIVPKPAPLPAFSTGSSPVLVDVEKTLELRRAPPSVPPPSVAPPAPGRSPVPAILAVVVLAGVGLAGVWFVGRRTAPAPTPSASSPVAAAPASSSPPATPTVSASAPPSSASAASPETPPPPAAAACKPGHAPVKLAPKASRDVPIDLAVFGASPRVAIGFSGDGRVPLASSLDPSTFGVRPEKTPPVVGKLRRVLPLPSAKGVKWLVNGDPKKLTRAEPVAIEPPFSIGAAQGALSLVEKPSDAPKKLWSLPGGAFDGARAVATGDSVVVAIRGGNAVHAGMIEGRAAKGELVRLSDDGLVGAPQIAASADEIAVVFAWRAKATDKWSLRFAHGPRTTAPAKATALTIPGGPGGDATAPTIAALEGGRWLVVWTEGSIVRASVLAADGTPSGAPWVVAKADQDGDLAAAVAAPGGAVIAYLVRVKGKPSELWAAGVSCP